MTTLTPDPWRDVRAARLPTNSLSALAAIRHNEFVRVLPDDAFAWVKWSAGRAEVVSLLLPVQGVTFYIHRAGLWYRFGCLIPSKESPPEDDGIPIAAVLFPTRLHPVLPELPALLPIVLTVVRGGTPRPTTALVCVIADLLKWAETATTMELAAIRGANCGDHVLLMGNRLPAIPRAVRYWGEKVLIPIGFRPDPDLPESALREALGVTPEEILLLDEKGAEVIPIDAIQPLTLAGVRLGARHT